MAEELLEEGLALLRRLTGREDAAFHDSQWEAISALVADKRRVLVVQRTGWGKSAVYFIATKLLRERGAGPTILVSPLLALMRNQVEAAQRMGVVARTINSSNKDDWAEIAAELQDGTVDLLLISPERLANASFRDDVLDPVGPLAGLVVVDEAHCISDWGHDFRPDYRRIRRILDRLPRSVPVLACTATANDRVVDDIVAQLGDDLVVSRGPLARASLELHAIELPSPADRLAWLAEVIPTLPGTGIVYCLTKRDAATVTEWLRDHDITAATYTGDSDGREAVERQLLGNDVKVVVATSALGMGFDKPDLAFVIHYQSPGSPIAYYQQVGRAGRQLDRSLGVLLQGHEDADIQDWFISRAFPTREEAEGVVALLDRTDGYTKLADIEQAVNLRPNRIQLLMTNLEVDGAVEADGRKYRRTGEPWAYDSARVAGITALRREEQAQMQQYGGTDLGCRMAFLGNLLDDPAVERCGRCDRCVGASLPQQPDPALARQAAQFLRRVPLVVEPRKKWPTMSNIPPGERVEVGRALGRLGDGGWGDLVRDGKRAGHFDDELVDGLLQLINTWRPEPVARWITYVPSRRHPRLVADLAERFGHKLGMPVHAVVEQVRATEPQPTMENSAQQHANVAGAYALAGDLPEGPALLIDDIVASRWTITEVGGLLRKAGCPAVHPLVLADLNG